MKIYIVYQFTEHAWGGANQFLRALRDVLRVQGMYSEVADTADVYLWNSYHQLFQILMLKRRFPKKYIIHRLGPVFALHRGRQWQYVDRLILYVNRLVADMTIFQSQWSLEQAVINGFDKTQAYCIIGNAPDGDLFFPTPTPIPLVDRKIRLVATSWSTNKKKGFDTYSFLDTALDWKKYEMTFIGNTPCRFTHIIHKASLSQGELAEQLRMHDIYIAPIIDDACSNAILEAIACGLPVVAKDSGGNKEIVGDGGVVFTDMHTCMSALERVGSAYDYFRHAIRVPQIEDVAMQYQSVCRMIFKNLPKPTPTHWTVVYISLKFYGFLMYDWYSRCRKNI